MLIDGGEHECVGFSTRIAEPAVEKGAAALLMLVSARRQLYDLSDDIATKVGVEGYSDVRMRY